MAKKFIKQLTWKKARKLARKSNALPVLAGAAAVGGALAKIALSPDVQMRARELVRAMGDQLRSYASAASEAEGGHAEEASMRRDDGDIDARVAEAH